MKKTILFLMLANYLKLAIRNLFQNKLYAAINIIGLAVGLGSAIVIMLFIFDELQYNRFHRNLSNIHLILQNQTQGGVTYTFEATPGPLAAGLRTEIPEIKHVFRYSWQGRHLLATAEKNAFERGYYAEPDFFRAMTFEVLAGDPVAALQDAGSVVISERTAKKFFGQEDALGKTLRHNNQRDLKVAAIIKDVPQNSSLRFDVVLPFRIFELMNSSWVNSAWGDNSLPTWVELQPGADIAALNKKLENYIQGKFPESPAHIFAYPLSDWRLYSKFTEGKQNGGRITLVWLLSIIAVFILLIACANFMNLATARSEKRAREVGVRKVVGAERSLIIGQFLSEAMLLTFLGLALSILMAFAMLPAFNRLTEKSLSLSVTNLPLWGGILGLGLITGLVAGTYPAFFLSRFKPIQVLRGNSVQNSRGQGGAWVRKGLVIFQFFISTALIISTITISKQIGHIQNRPIGYDQSNLISIPARGDMNTKFDALRNALEAIPAVESVAAGTDNLIQFGSNTSGIHWPGKQDDQDFLIGITWVSPDWAKTAGLELVEGRDFNAASPGDSLCCLINETAAQRMGLSGKAIGTVLRHDTTYTVIGVIKDFVYNSPTEKVSPLVVYLGNSDFNHFFVRYHNDDNWKGTITQIEQASRQVNPAYPFDFRFVKDEYQKSYNEIQSTNMIARVFGGMAILISCLGLLGLSAFMAERRRKEIGVRKVLGATVQSIWLFLSGEFLKPVLAGFILAVPLAAWGMEKLLSTLEYRIELGWTIFAIAGIIAFGVALMTVSYQGIKAALTNPTQALRSE